ncbi:MAG: hypothetical protein HND57_13480 [Planctomycetes bacterium]|nr:hypothetical protein [Planctomycetota bacterium]
MCYPCPRTGVTHLSGPNKNSEGGWRADVSAIVTSGGYMVEWIKYSPYGIPFGLPGGDTDSDGDCDATDIAQIQSWIDASSYDVRGDLDLDGGSSVDSTDKSIAQSNYQGTTSGWNDLTAIGNRKGYAGYEWDGVVSMYHVRHRVLHPVLGRWTRRDPLGYVDGMNVYEYVTSAPTTSRDRLGLSKRECGNRGCQLAPLDQPKHGIEPFGDSPFYFRTFDPFMVPPPNSEPAPPPVIDPSCTNDPVADCTGNPQFDAALARYSWDCRNSQRPPVTIRCTQQGNSSFNCNHSRLTYNVGRGCASLAHELLHAADACKVNDSCTHDNPDDPNWYCRYRMCKEARSAAYTSCCDANHPWRQSRTWEQCVDDARDTYVNNLSNIPECRHASRAEMSSWWEECMPDPRTEDNACSGEIPPMW